MLLWRSHLKPNMSLLTSVLLPPQPVAYRFRDGMPH